jgi:hypothetical protein
LDILVTSSPDIRIWVTGNRVTITLSDVNIDHLL